MTKNQFLSARARSVFSLLALLVAVFAIAPRAFAQANPNPPERLAYQGYLVDANGMPLATNAPKNYDVIFRIWNDPTGAAAGNRLWTEQQTVTVDKGYFSVVLGEGSISSGESRPALSSIFTNSTASERWIGLTVKGIGSSGSDANILPRLRLITSPYAFLATKATSVDGAGVTSGTVADTRLSTNVALRSGGNTFSGNQIINNSLGIGVSPNPNRPLTVNGAGNTGINLVNTTPSTGKPYLITSLDDGRLLIKDDLTGSLQFWMDKVNSTFSLNGGNVGIGTTAPQAKLHVSGGNIQLDSGNQLFFADNGVIQSFDANHRILFRRNENKLELLEYGDILFSPGTNTKAVILANGNMGIGTNSPQARLHVAGTLRVDGAGNFLGSNPYFKFSDERPKNTEGGTANTGINTRVFNTKVDPQNLGSLVGTNAFSLPAGTYQCRISAPAYRVNQHQARLRIANSTNLIFGTTEYANSSTVITTHSLISGQFTLSSTSTLVVEHYVASGNPDNGFGTRANASWTDGNPVEVYTVAEFWKIQ